MKAWHELADAAALQLRKRDQIQVMGYLATYTTPAGYSRLQVGGGTAGPAQSHDVSKLSLIHASSLPAQQSQWSCAPVQVYAKTIRKIVRELGAEQRSEKAREAR